MHTGSPVMDTLPRVIIEKVEPEVDGGRFAVKRTTGDLVRVQATVFADGHDELSCRLRYRPESDPDWLSTPMQLLANDRWQGEFRVDEQRPYVYMLEAWVDGFRTWRRDLEKRFQAGQDIAIELSIGAKMVRGAAARAPAPEASRLAERADALEKQSPQTGRFKLALETSLATLMDAYAERGHVTEYDRGQRIEVDRERARFSAWYEMFPRSTSGVEGEHGTLRTCAERLPYVQALGFDVLYLPPIHPIGISHRKGKNNSPEGRDGDPGSPWAIGAASGGHTAIHAELGTLADFKTLVSAAKALGMEVALDLALQCSPDHPWVKEHPSWFKHRPDGSIRYAENPPKKYEDIFPLDFDTEDWQVLWNEVESVVCFWVDQGVRIFRVDNPHTKPLALWEWLIARVRESHPDVLFLAEAFTRPATMQRLAKLGFSQSYTYFTWRNSKWELSEYMRELTQTDVKEYFRPNFWPNTPDILHEYLQTGGRTAFMTRLVLAATLSANYGIYGPAFELCVNLPREPGSEEYLDSEKYEVKFWDLDAPYSLREFIGRVNRIRKQNSALQRNDGFQLLDTNNDQLFTYSKQSEDGNRVVVVVNLDPHNLQSGWVRVPHDEFGLVPGESFELHDLLDGGRYTWRGEWNYVELNPHILPAHILRLESPVAERAPSGGAPL
jgi:starch synthase (maltosyl-transferring)